MDFMTVNDLQELLYYSTLFADAEYRSALCLFHYTNACTKQYIIAEDHLDLRLTRADCFADVNEGQHIIEVFRNAVNVCVACQKIDQMFANALLSVITDFSEICEELRKFYIFCFSKNGGNKYLEQNYACKDNATGVVIGFQALDIENLDEIEFQNEHPVDLIDVLYDKQDLSCYMQSLVCRMYQLREQDDKKLSICKKIAVNQLAIYSLAYKSSEFQHEEETRLIIDFGKIDSESDKIVTDKDESYIHVTLEPSSLYNIREVIL